MTSPRLAAALSCTLLVSACDFDVPDLNRPGLDQILTNPTPATVESAATGLVAGARADIAERIGYVSELGILGRESYVLSGSDDRFVTQLLGPPLDPGTSNFGGNFWVAPYANIRNANLVIDALPKVTTGFTDAEKAAITGFAKTMMALDFLKVINTRDTNGAAIDVDLPIGQLAPLVGKAAVFQRIADLLDQGKAQLTAAGTTAFPFPLGNGFTSFSTPADFLKFNRALAARVAVYRGQYAAALLALDESFLDTNASLSLGAYHSFGIGSGDLQDDLNTTDIFVHPSIVTDAEPLSPAPAGCSGLSCLDNRVQAKVTPFLDASGAPTTQTLYGLTSGYNFKLYPNKDSPVPIIRNEELILLRAEANIGLVTAGDPAGSLGQAKADLNFIRTTSGGIAPRGGLNAGNILDELLKQKRFSLLFEGGHRWIDARRYGKLSTLPIDVPGQTVQPNFPIPTPETDARH